MREIKPLDREISITFDPGINEKYKYRINFGNSVNYYVSLEDRDVNGLLQEAASYNWAGYWYHEPVIPPEFDVKDTQ